MPAPPDAMTGMLTASLTAAVSSQSKPARVPSASIEVSRISPAPRASASRAHSTTRRPVGLRPPCTKTCASRTGSAAFGIAARIDGDDYGLRAEVAADGVDERGIGKSGGVDADLVGAGFEDLLGVAGGANAAADAEGHEELARGAAHGVEQRLAAFVRGGDVEQNDFVGAFAGVARGLRGGIAGVDEIDELHAFDDAAGVDIEAGDDALGQHAATPEKIAENLEAGCAGFFGMELHAHHVAALDGCGEWLDVMRDGSGVGW